MKIDLPEKVEYIISSLEAAGYEGYAVGGCIRDSIIGRVPEDWDITTSAFPEDIKRIFRRTVDTGIQHGTVTVLLGDDAFEVTTYRVDGKYEDGRHPSSVRFVRSLEEDLLRRDFTINAMAYNDTSGLVDIFDGKADLDAGIIRCVGDARQRFSEDALRMMRAVRFSAQLGYEIEGSTKVAIKELAPTLGKVSAERIRVELMKTLLSGNPDKIRDMHGLGLTKVFLPELDEIMNLEQNTPHHYLTVGEHTIKVVENVPAKAFLRLSALMHDFGKAATKTTDETGRSHFHGHPEVSAEMAKGILRRLKFDNETLRRVVPLVRWHDFYPELTKKSVRRAIRKIGQEQFPDIFELKRADILAQSSYRQQEKLDYVARYREIWEEIMAEADCLRREDLAVSGKDLIDAGVAPGREIGKILDAMLEDVIDTPEHNDREYLIKKYLQ